MTRTEAAYRARFRALLKELPEGAQVGLGIGSLLDRARDVVAREGLALDEALARTYDATRAVVRQASPPPVWSEPPRFLCDESLGGLARWLHVAGFEAVASRGLKGDGLLRAALEGGRVLVTSDGQLLERRLVTQGRVRMVWVPSRLSRGRQLERVLGDLGLAAQPPRCMSCGGRLLEVPKDSVKNRIPPRTALWKDVYFVCQSCGQLLWQGTHWERIERRLEEVIGESEERRSPPRGPST